MLAIDSGSHGLAPIASSASALQQTPAVTPRRTAAFDLRVARKMVEPNAPQPAAPYSQPSVRASPANTSRAKIGSSTV